jgi:hypothetical protein
MSDCVRVYQAEDAETEDDQVCWPIKVRSLFWTWGSSGGGSVAECRSLFFCGTGLSLQRFVPAERPDEDPFDKERMRRSMLIRRFLVFMRDIKQRQHSKGNCEWPPVIAGGSKQLPPAEENWNKWKSKVRVLI